MQQLDLKASQCPCSQIQAGRTRRTPLLKAKAKKTEWFCRALTFVLPQGQADQCHRRISRMLALLLQFSVSAARGMHQKALAIALSMLAHYNWLSKWGDGTL